MRVLGIETSCDETATAIVEYHKNGTGKILSNIIWSQIDEHAPFGGVVPEIAARAHVEKLDSLIAQALKEADMPLDALDGFAATAGPGLIGGLIVGMMSAKTMAQALNKPFIGVNHLEGHALTAQLTEAIAPPYLLLLVSGGHSQIVVVEALGRYQRLGTTIDDALGEAFDKTAKLLNLPYPGGPAVEKAALEGDEQAYPLPRPMKGHKSFDFSFSGLKTAVRQLVHEIGPLDRQKTADIAASFQLAVADSLIDRLKGALDYFAARYPNIEEPALVLAGGVGANKKIRQSLENLCGAKGFLLVAPPAHLCSDNAAMIAFAGAQHLSEHKTTPLDFAPRARWPLDEQAPARIGSGRRGAKA